MQALNLIFFRQIFIIYIYIYIYIWVCRGICNCEIIFKKKSLGIISKCQHENKFQPRIFTFMFHNILDYFVTFISNNRVTWRCPSSHCVALKGYTRLQDTKSKEWSLTWLIITCFVRIKIFLSSRLLVSLRWETN